MSCLLLQTPGRILKTFLGPCALLSVIVIVGKVGEKVLSDLVLHD